ncbi:hypothetical protein UA08_06397 [Talaromyces atroroseus]|uniref:phosphatidylserine decarboxylase n=1 Tax=Talaromyces atroroseus TaxID=1441469 RepID=A0A225AXW2_TALAT|nr:hypothetical protein UA08_06397 [Talaromyces atroroseus]OKL58327.1 hypothetical protein UA08_06397 [Talaromyces atroroseus]
MNGVRLFHSYGVVHEKFMWDARMEPGVLDAFTKLWGTDEPLLASPGSMKTKAPTSAACIAFKASLVYRPRALVVYPGSHLLNDEFFDARPGSASRQYLKDIYIFPESELAWFEQRGLKPLKVCAQPGDLILRDSRTIHYGSDPTEKGTRIRTAIYATYMPARLANADQLERKKKVFEEYGNTTHWPFEHIEPGSRRALPLLKNGEVDPRLAERNKPLEMPEMSDKLLKLAGIQNREVGWKTIQRRTGREMREQQPLWKKLKLFALFNPLTEWLDTTHAMRLHLHAENVHSGQTMHSCKRLLAVLTEVTGEEEGSSLSKGKIRAFVDFFHINMDDFEPSNIEDYHTFKEFFIRKHKPGSRPIHAEGDNSVSVVVADSRLVVYETVTATKKIWIKGSDFSIAMLTMDNDIGDFFNDGAVASFRLSPQDYHRYHSPVTGRIASYRSIPGDYYQVDPIALRSGVDILSRNTRAYVEIDSEYFGKVLFVAIGATDVGSVQIHDQWKKPGNSIQKGEELGLFQFGGSSIIVVFQNGFIKFDDDLLRVSENAIAMDVEVGMSLGKATKAS